MKPKLARVVVLGLLLSVLGPNAPALAEGVSAQGGGGHGHGQEAPRPLVFVHGSAGSGSQYATQAQRFASNGYPLDRIAAHEYDSTFAVNTREEVYTRLDERITALLAETGADKIDLLAHSLGTALMIDYLTTTPERAARVAHYVNYDGRTATALPGGVPTLAVWGQGPETRQIVGATNVRFDQSHTEVVTSAESFAAVYRFLRDREPRTTRVVPEHGPFVTVSGRAVIFPQNVGVTGARLEIHRIDGRTGARRSARPAATFAISADGAWGPFRAWQGAHYEFVLIREGAPQHHFYVEPFVRDDHLVRLLTGEPGTGLGALVDTSERHTAVTVTRNKEWWGDQGEAGDALAVNGTNVLNAATAPQAKRVIGMFVFDDSSDGVTNLAAPIADIYATTFMSGVDLFVPAADQPKRPHGRADRDRRVRIEVTPRGGGGRTQKLTIPNWRSDGHRITVQFREWA